jgi:acyl carrier protein
MCDSREQFVDHSFEAPNSGVEKVAARIIAEVLNVDQVGRTDSFYDFGGTSLQAIRICARLEAEIGCRIPPDWLFTSDIVADFASKVEGELDGERVVTSEANE